MKKALYISLAFLAPALALAQFDTSNVMTLTAGIMGFINSFATPLIFAIALVAFLWGIVQYFIAGGADEEKRENGKKFITWGIIAFFVMVSVWGLVNLLVNTFGFQGQSRPCIPTFDGSQNCAGSSSASPTGTSGISCQTAFDCGGLACLNGVCASGNGVN